MIILGRTSTHRPPRRRRALLVGAALALAVGPSILPVSALTAEATASEGKRAGLPSWWFDAMQLEKAHREVTGKGVTVAVIDVAINRPAADIKGADVTLRVDCLGNKLKSANADIGDHGTAMVTMLAGTGHGNAPGGLGVRGIAPDAKVLFYGMDTNLATPAQEGCDSSNGAMLFNQAVKDGADIITTSLGFVGSDEMRAAVKGAVANGVVVVGAAGDVTRAVIQGRPSYPTPEDGAISVNAVNEKARPWVNNPPALVDYGQLEYPVMSAPGVKVDSSGYEKGRGWVSGGTRTGTSDAAPILAGALALVKEKYPDATANQLIQNLIHNPSGGAYGWDAQYGFGIVSVTQMLAQDPTGWPDENPLTKGPKAAVEDYPASSYGSAPSPSASPTPSPSASQSGGSKAKAQASAAAESDESDESEGGGVPVWVWPVAGLLVVGGIFLAVTRLRGARPPAE